MPYGWTTYEFRGEEDLKHYKCFILAKAWDYPQFKPLYSYLWHTTIPYSQQYAMESVSTPTSKGMADIIYKGYKYISIIIPPEEEVAAREPVFREKMKPIIDDIWGYWDNYKNILKGYYDRYIPMSKNLANMTDMEVLTYWRELTEYFWRVMWEIHMMSFYATTMGMLLFRDAWVKFTGLNVDDPKFAKVLSGFDNSLFQLNKGLADLANSASTLNVEDNLKLSDKEVLPAMEQSESGKKWLGEFDSFLDEHGLRMDRMLEICTPTWIEEPHRAVAEIKRLHRVGASHAPDVERERLRKEGAEIENELLDNIASDEDKKTFKRLLHFAQGICYLSEDHDYWCEFKSHSLIRLATIELAKRFVKAGQMDEPEDIFYVLPDQIVWASVLGKGHDLHEIVEKNKAEYNGYMALGEPPNEEVPMFLGDPSHIPNLAAADAAINIVMGERVALPEDVGATCVGAAGAPGVVEGIARVLYTSEQWDDIQPGEILVTPMTAATWTPLYSIVKAVVTDAGGLLAHAAIVAREYGIPCVVGTMEATQKIKTGDRIRVDGNTLQVHVL